MFHQNVWRYACTFKQINAIKWRSLQQHLKKVYSIAVFPLRKKLWSGIKYSETVMLHSRTCFVLFYYYCAAGSVWGKIMHLFILISTYNFSNHHCLANLSYVFSLPLDSCIRLHISSQSFVSIIPHNYPTWAILFWQRQVGERLNSLHCGIHRNIFLTHHKRFRFWCWAVCFVHQSIPRLDDIFKVY